MDWDLQPRDTIRRVELHRCYGGGRIGRDQPLDKDGIGPPAENIGVGSFWSHWTSL
jgi:hypothetical protein